MLVWKKPRCIPKARVAHPLLCDHDDEDSGAVHNHHVPAVEHAHAERLSGCVYYPFQADYGVLWDLEVAGFREVAQRNPAIQISVEYKPSDPRRTALIRSMADALLAVQAVDLQNFGVTIDFCHSLMAGEQPAAAAALALRTGRLFGVHLNDGYGPADDGLMVGSVHLWQTLELLLELRKGGFAGTIYFDTFPDRVDPAAECAANVQSVQRMQQLLDRMPASELGYIRKNQDAIAATQLIQNLLLGPKNI